jgi:Tfp pilus assembly protein PilN
MRAVNLLPEQKRSGGAPTVLTTTSVLVGGASVLTALGLFLGVSYTQSHGRVTDRQQTLAGLQSRVESLQAARTHSVVSQSGDQARVAAITTAAAGQMRWDHVLDDISRVLPAGSWLSSLDMQAPGPVTPVPAASTPTTDTTSPTAFTVSGVAFTQDIVAQVMQRLELVPALSDVTLQSSTRTTVGTAQAYQFTMSANVLPPEVPAQ